jgi:hypothetical protein
MTSEQVKSVLNVAPKSTITLNDSNSVEVYEMTSGGYGSRYYLSYNRGKLVYWGYPHEYAREKDPTLNRIAKETTEKLDALKTAQPNELSK